MPDPLDLDKMLSDAKAACSSKGRDATWVYDEEDQKVREPAQGFVTCSNLYHVDGVHIANMDPPTTIALIERLQAAEAALRELADAEARYRELHDIHGGSSLKSGMAWDQMRAAGNRARAALAQREEPGDADAD